MTVDTMSVDKIKLEYRGLMGRRGETVSIRRYSGTPREPDDVDIQAVVIGYAPNELIGTVMQGDRRAIILAEDLVAAQFPGPVTSNDKLVVRGKELAIIAADDSTRRVAGVLIAYELQVRG
jgi:hypothetical protein